MARETAAKEVLEAEQEKVANVANSEEKIASVCLDPTNNVNITSNVKPSAA